MIYLILSGAFVKEEMQYEVGMIPPAFLPVANKRLFAFQIESILKNESQARIYLSVPEQYIIDTKDKKYLELHNVEIIYLDSNLDLGDSIYMALESIQEDGKINIIYGDTLISDFSLDFPAVAIGQTRDSYHWHVERQQDSVLGVWAGYFLFSSKSMLQDVMTSEDNDFINCVSRLINSKDMKLEQVDKWKDFGHVVSFFRSRSSMTTERDFNSIAVVKNQLFKRSRDLLKLRSEAYWFENIPPGLKRLSPNFLDNSTNNDDPFYSIEFLYLLPLNELYVNALISEGEWDRIISAAREYFRESIKYSLTLNDNEIRKLEDNRLLLLQKKTIDRLNQYRDKCPIDLDKEICINEIQLPSVYQIANEMIVKSLAIEPCFSVIHGDYCYSNILYDSRSKMIKMIDPRGIDAGGKSTIFGDLVYDIAKFYHSSVGLYDFIISKAYDLEIDGQKITFEIFSNYQADYVVKKLKNESLIPGIGMDEVMPLVVLLFLSMIPLHSDKPENQAAFLANALLIYSRFEKK